MHVAVCGVVQLLLVVCAGSMTASMPFVAALYAGVLTAWSAAVVRLDSHMHLLARGQSQKRTDVDASRHSHHNSSAQDPDGPSSREVLGNVA